MIEKNKKENIGEEIKRAKETMRVVNLLVENNFVNDAISKLYYFLLYNVRALLLTKGLEPKSHEGALRLFGLHFVKKGIFNPRDSHIFSKLMKFREEADYNPSYAFTNEDFIEFKKEAEELADKIRKYLRKKRYI